MAHPSDSLPKDIYVLDGTNALVTSNGKKIYAIHNPTADEIIATVKGSIHNWSASALAYAEVSASTSDDIPVQPGATLYGRFTSCSAGAADLICYVS